MPTMYGFAMWDASANRWDTDMPGPQDRSNCFETFEDAYAELPNLAKVLDCEESLIKVAEIWVQP